MSSLSRVATLAGGLAFFLAGGWLGWTRNEPVRMTFLSVGQGDCAVIQAEGRTVLIDVGPRSSQYDAGERMVLPKLRRLGVARVDLILLSHPDMDHMGGLAAIVRAYPDARVALSSGYRDDSEWRSHLATLGIPRLRIDWLGPESRGRVGPLALRIACPPYDGGNSNDGSMFVRVAWGKAAAVFSGDAPQSVEEVMLRRGDWSAEVVKVGHHGSRTSASPAWLRAVHARWAVISCGRENSYGHPHRDVLERLTRFDEAIARTDREGDVAFELRDGHFVRLSGNRPAGP